MIFRRLEYSGSGGSGAIFATSIRALSKNLIYQLAKISINKLIFSNLHRGGAPSGTSSAHRRLSLNRQLMGLTTATGFATKLILWFINNGFYTLFLCINLINFSYLFLFHFEYGAWSLLCGLPRHPPRIQNTCALPNGARLFPPVFDLHHNAPGCA